jgi:hypothetical protein
MDKNLVLLQDLCDKYNYHYSFNFAIDAVQTHGAPETYCVSDRVEVALHQGGRFIDTFDSLEGAIGQIEWELRCEEAAEAEALR